LDRVLPPFTLANLATSLSDGSLAFQMQRLAEFGRAAVVVEGDYPDLFRTQPGRGSWLADMLGRLAVRYPEVPIIFAGSRKFAEEWAYRFLGAAVGDSGPETEPSSKSDWINAIGLLKPHRPPRRRWCRTCRGLDAACGWARESP
jgi:hypothetical protein